MICSNCNNEIPDGSKFCPVCGTPTALAQSAPQNAPTQQMPQGTPVQGMPQGMPQNGPAQQMPPKPPMDPKKKQQLIIAISVVAAILILIIAAVKTHKTKIDVTKYTKVKFSGYEKYGTASIDFDYDKMYKDIAQSSKVQKAIKKNAYFDVDTGFTYKLDKKSSLKNGQTVTVKYTFDNDRAKQYGIKFVGDKKEFQVKGLKKVTDVDPFETVTVTFTGVSPNANASIDKGDNNGEIIDGKDYREAIDYQLSKTDDIAIGDVVTVTAKCDGNTLLENYGVKLTTTTKDFTCEAADKYITAISEIDESMLATMQTQSEDEITSYFADESEDIKKSEMKYEGLYVLGKKELDSWSANNYIYVIYSATVKSKGKGFKATTVYFPIRFSNVIRRADGSIDINLDNSEIMGQTRLEYGDWGFDRVKGFTSISKMYNDLGNANKSEYTVDATPELTK